MYHVACFDQFPFDLCHMVVARACIWGWLDQGAVPRQPGAGDSRSDLPFLWDLSSTQIRRAAASMNLWVISFGYH